MKRALVLLAVTFALGVPSLQAREAVVMTSEFFLMIRDPCERSDSSGPTWCKKLYFRLVRRSDCREFKPKGNPDIRYCAGMSPATPCEDVGYSFYYAGLTYRMRWDGMHVEDKYGATIRTEAADVIVTKSPKASFQLAENKCALSGADLGSELAAGLSGAIRRNDAPSVQRALQQGAKVNAQDVDGWTPVLWASITRGSAETVRILLSQGAELSVIDPFGRTPLILAAWSRDEQVMQILIDKGVDVNATDKKGESALIAAARRGNVKQVRILLRAGAAVDYEDLQGRTALSHAFEAHKEWPDTDSDRWACVGLLLQAGASLDRSDSKGITPFRYISRSGHCAPVDTQLVQMIASKVPSADVDEIVNWASNRRSEPENCDVLAAALKKSRP